MAFIEGRETHCVARQPNGVGRSGRRRGHRGSDGAQCGSRFERRAERRCGGQPCTWNFVQIKVPSAQPDGRHGAGVTVAVVDTWVDHTHPELRERVVGHASCVDAGGRCRADTRSPDECGHGTHVAGTIASRNYGVAPQANVLAVQVLRYDGGTCTGSAEDVAAGIRFSAAQGAQVINLSLGALVPGLFQSQAVTSAVREAARTGAVVVFAAGNSTVPLSDNYGSDAVLVAATGPDGSVASYSSRGGAIDLAAPGGDDGAGGLSGCRKSTCILSTEPNGAYTLRAGTSMAAPHVSGAAALLLAQDPGRGPANVITTLRETARSLSGVRHGLIDADAALRLNRPPSPSPTPSSGAPTGAAATSGPAGQAGPPAAPPRNTRSGAELPGVGPYATDLAHAGSSPQSGAAPGRSTDIVGGGPSTDPSPSLAHQPRADASRGFPMPVAVAIVAVVALIAAGALWVSAGRRRGSATHWPEH